ncbi:hypothetical protein ABZ845_16770 [Streptomyces sp. NPDC047022]|uniref:hypothetical protein n=1 Tax=Streptomyces sp. NPDC047022 TaxID=3155737 RepID=UPI0033FE88F8
MRVGAGQHGAPKERDEAARRACRGGRGRGGTARGGGDGPGVCGDECGLFDGDLITAINNANAGSGDTLVLTSYCVYTLTDADGSLPTIRQPLIIHGNNATIRRDPNGFNLFDSNIPTNCLLSPQPVTGCVN